MKGLEDKVVGVRYGGIWELGSPNTRRVGMTNDQSIFIADLSNVNLLDVNDIEEKRSPRPVRKQLRQEQHVELPLAAFDRYSFVPWEEIVNLIKSQPKKYDGELADRVALYRGDLALTIPRPESSIANIHYVGYVKKWKMPDGLRITNSYPRNIVNEEIMGERIPTEIIDINRSKGEVFTDIPTKNLLNIIVLRRHDAPFLTYPENPYSNPINFTGKS